MAQILEPEDVVAYDDRQQLYVLNFAANSVGASNNTQDALEDAMERALSRLMVFPLLGWRLVWGPKVWKTSPNDPETPPTNAWYVATKGNKCVLAIAGTAPQSLSGWMQDFDVVNTVQWDKWVSSWPKDGEISPPRIDQADDSMSTIAHGTAQGVWNILSNKSTRAASGTYVQDFLKQQPAGTEIFVVGHSMGGALAPTVALGLVQSQIITDKNVYVEASAGPSPGNAKFTELWASQFSNTIFYNTKDVVPQAWQVAPGKDRCLPNIYNIIFADQEPRILGQITEITKNIGERLSRSSGITYVPLPGRPFTSKISIPKMNDLQKELATVMKAQHGLAYLEELGLVPVIREFERDLNDTLSD